MKSLISVNNKFMDVSPKELVNLILQSKYTKGIEIYLDSNSEFELKYLDDLVFELKRNNLILQVHGEIELDYDKQIEYIRKLEKYSEYLDSSIVFTLHTIYDEDKDISLNKTNKYIERLIEDIDNNKIIVCLENLNDIEGYKRLGKEDIKEVILNNELLFFTYDIGHEIINYKDITNLDKYMIDDMRNVHLHTFRNNEDHIPIYKNDEHWNEVMKGLTFLKINNYKYNIVYEYGLNYCVGATTKDRIIDYLNSIDYVSERY